MNKSEELANKQLNEELGTNGVNYFLPNNFIKLIELQVSKKLIVGRYFQGSGQYRVPFSNQWYDRESFLNILIDCLKRTDKWCARNRNRIIKKIQQTEWEY